MIKFLLLVTYAALARATYSEWFYSNGSCPGLGYSCSAPYGVCAWDNLLRKYYCCGAGGDDAICWTGGTVCEGGKNQPSSSQDLCKVEGVNFCCEKTAEICTESTGQFNICWATQPDIIANVSQQALNESYSSLSSASPGVPTLTFNATQLAVAAPSTTSATGSTSSIATSSTTTSTSTHGATSSTATPKSSQSFSGGDIAGVVVGSVAGIALIAGVIYFMLRRRKQSKWNDPPVLENPSQYEKRGGIEDQAYAKPELGVTPARYELDHRGSNASPKELAGSNPGPYEVQGSGPAKPD